MSKQCVWTQEECNGDCWDTSCAGLFSLNDGTPSDNHMKFCPYCGGELVEKTWVPELDESDATLQRDRQP